MLSWHFLSREIFNFAISIAICASIYVATKIPLYVATKMPLGRWKISAKRFIAASPATIWAYADPRLGLAIVFRKDALVKDFAIISQEPLTAQYQVRMSPASEFESHRSVYTEIVAMKGYNECVVWSNGAEIDEKSRVYETLTIEEVEGGSMVRKTWSTPVTGLRGFEFWRRGMQRWLAGLDDALVAKPLKVVPFIKFSNWRMVLFSIIGMYFLLAWGSFDGPDYQRYVPLVEVAFYFGTILLHEFGHAFMFLIFGHRPVTIGIKLWGDAFAMGSKVSRSEFEDGMICIGGILFCIIAAILIFPMIFPLHDILLKNTSKGVKFLVLYNPDILKPILAWSLIMIIIFINGLNMTSFCGSDGEGVLRVLFPTLHLRKLASIAVLCCMMTMFDARISFVLGSLVIINTNNRKFDKRLYIVPENVAPANSIQKLILGTLFVVVISLYIVVGQTASFAAKPFWNWS